MICLGDVVELRQPCLGNPRGAIGLALMRYHEGVTVMFENGNFDGFHEGSEQSNYLHVLLHGVSVPIYSGVIPMAEDYRAGSYKHVFVRDYLRKVSIGDILSDPYGNMLIIRVDKCISPDEYQVAVIYVSDKSGKFPLGTRYTSLSSLNALNFKKLPDHLYWELAELLYNHEE